MEKILKMVLLNVFPANVWVSFWLLQLKHSEVSM